MPKVSLQELRNFKYRINPEERQGSYGLYFMRHLSVFVTWLCLNVGLTANQVTILQTISSVLGAVCLALPPTLAAGRQGEVLSLILGVLLLQFGFLLDNVDGEVARFRKQVSVTGKFIDSVGHEIVVPCMYFGLGLGSFFRTGHVEAVIFGFLAGLFSLRFDVASLYQEAGQLIESQLDKDYDYYTNFRTRLSSKAKIKVYRRKNEEGPIRLVYALFAYPGTMNIISITVVIQLFISRFEIFGETIEPLSLILAIYGIALPIRRVITISKLAHGREVERKYLSLVENAKKIQSTTAEKVEDQGQEEKNQ